MRRGRLSCVTIALLYSAAAVWGQTAEVTSKETPFTFSSGVNMVPVPVVVRDAKGNAVGGLSIGDFQLFDNGKPQMISKFSLEALLKATPAATSLPAAVSPIQNNDAATLVPAESDGIPDRFVAYLFDDLHLSLPDLVRTRDAAMHQLDARLQPLERVAIYTTSGRTAQEFTADRDKLHTALAAIGAGPAASTNAMQRNTCPSVDYYMGDRIYNKRDLDAWRIATKDAVLCGDLGDSTADIQIADVSQCDFSGSSDGVCKAVKFAKEAARSAVLMGDRDSEAALEMLRSVVNRMTAMPGQRNVVLVSPGFLVLDDRRDEQTALTDRAIKAKVLIGGLDSRGLYSQIQGGDASERTNSRTMVDKIPYKASATLMQTDVMASLADGTGGTFYHGTNDYDEGFTRVAAAPEYLYVLGFSPLDLKLDGKFHNLKVTLRNGSGLELQVRKGYYAPNSLADPAGQAKRQIEEAFFSREEIHDLAAVLQTQYFKADNGDATLSAVAKVDVKKLSYKKEGDRNRNDITVVTGVFDNDGNFVNGAQKVVEMRLLDDTLEKRAASGISVKSSFAVHSGRYVVRMVVRDSEGQTMSAQSSLVEIP